jgi:DNA-binding NtrC family response regulator
MKGRGSALSKVPMAALNLEPKEAGVRSSENWREAPQWAAGIVAESRLMRETLHAVRQVARTRATVLLHGETGTGKELLARSLHELSDRRDQPFEVVDCGSMSPSLIASELMGHERGAFTGAHEQRAGAFERADGGTVFLDEIGELPLELQPMLLGILERRRFRRLGGNNERSIDVRIVSATHRDLRLARHAGGFRSDLYYRLAVARVLIPPLRARPEDIAPLLHRFMAELADDAYAPVLDEGLLRELERRPWEGNVRELRNWVESFLAFGGAPCDEDELEIPACEPANVSYPELPYREARAHATAEFERGYLASLLEACGYNASEAARRAKMDRSYLLGLLRKHGLRSSRA